MNLKYSVRDIVESAMLIALAVVLDLDGVKIPIREGGGSISFTMIPLFVLALRQGPLKGFVGCGIIYGLITCLKDGWGLYTFPFDYLLGYGSMAILGFFSKFIFSEKTSIKSILFLIFGTIISGVSRFVFACISSTVLYQTSLLGAIIYNSAYVFPSLLICLIVLLALYKPLQLINKKFQSKSID